MVSGLLPSSITAFKQYNKIMNLPQINTKVFQTNGMRATKSRLCHTSQIEQAFNRLYNVCLIEISPNLTFMECYVTFKVLKDRYHTFRFLLDQGDVVCDVTLNKVYLDDYQRETVNHPMWDTLKTTFATIILQYYPTEEIFKRHPKFPTLDQLCADYMAEASRMAARRRP
ncbi:peptide chain release factor 1 [Striga asiatica]|uniref:Peptide chain release factor 1 n=1 Tax=Striga asiatica TaxID=4170 RepID=A0A5A7PJ17_STRAF|nr:peptide chain release factor 1 [Striga asiatica]